MTFPKKDSYDTYGGDLVDLAPSKSFHFFGAKDIPAQDFNSCKATIAGATQTGFQCYIKWNGSSGDILQYKAAWDILKTPRPIIGEADVGMWYVQFPAYYYDLRGDNIKRNMNINSFVTNMDMFNDQNSNPYFSTGQRIYPNYCMFYTYAGGQFTEDVGNVDLFFF